MRVAALVSIVLAGCAGDVRVRPRRSPPPSTAPDPATAGVRVRLAWPHDGHTTSRDVGERTAAFGVSLGNVVVPGGATAVRDAVADALRAAGCIVVGEEEPADVVLAGVTEQLEIDTPATALYWDVVAHARAGVRLAGGTDPPREYAGEARERTWIWPGEAITTRVLQAALDELRERVAADATLRAAIARAAGRPR